MAILKAARQLAIEANVHVHIRKFSVINEVGAVSIDAKLDCDAFASTHSATSHYDRASFVGLAWRPGGEHICCGALRAIQPIPDTPRVVFPQGAAPNWQRSTPRARPTCLAQRASATC